MTGGLPEGSTHGQCLTTDGQRAEDHRTMTGGRAGIRMSRDVADAPGGGTWLRAQRERLLLTQEDLAARSGVDARTIRDIETGRTARPRPSTVRLLTDALAGPQRDVIPDSSPSAVRPPAQLPADVPGFTGRAAELGALDALLDRDEPATVVISAIAGTAGVGKTALAIHWAHQVRDRYPDGQLYVNLRGYDPEQPMTPAQALAGFLAGLGVAGHDVPLDLDQRAARFRSETAHRRLLIVLDNASSVEQVRPLLPGGSNCTVLVTSRDSLAALVAVHGADRIDLDLLPHADALALLRRLIGHRIDSDAAAAARLSRQCAGLPLALRVAAELAASRPAEPASELVAELTDEQRRLDLLDAGGDPRAAVTAVFSWSYRNLPADTARMFRLLGLHPGQDFDVYAAAALAATTVDDARRLLGLLRRAHLVQPTAPARLGMHDLLKAYATQLARLHDAEPDRQAAIGRLIDYYLGTAVTAMNRLHPAEAEHRPKVLEPAGPDLGTAAQARSWLDEQLATLTSIAAHSADHGWPERAVQLSITLSRYFYEGHNAEAVIVHDRARVAAQSCGDRAGEAHALVSMGVTNALGGRPNEAVELLQQALAIYRQLDDRYGLARALNNLGGVEERAGDYRSALDHLAESVRVAQAAGARDAVANALSSLGYTATIVGQLTMAAAVLQETIAIDREIGSVWNLTRALTNLGLVHYHRGDYASAADCHRQAAQVARDNGDKLAEAHAIAGLADVDLRTGRPADAARRFDQALAQFLSAGDHHNVAWALNGLGETERIAGRPGAAVRRHTEALTVANRIGNPQHQLRAHQGLALAYGDLADSDAAHRHDELARALRDRLGIG
jgi:tetratricopeptide (TPR) repeat protein/transcriptional regulator with XRE-family HTH domain